MKRFLHRLPLLFVVLLLLTTAVFADMGPKPQLTVVVEQPALRSGGNSPATLPDPRIITASAITASQRHTAF